MRQEQDAAGRRRQNGLPAVADSCCAASGCLQPKKVNGLCCHVSQVLGYTQCDVSMVIKYTNSKGGQVRLHACTPLLPPAPATAVPHPVVRRRPCAGQLSGAVVAQQVLSLKSSCGRAVSCPSPHPAPPYSTGSAHRPQPARVGEMGGV